MPSSDLYNGIKQAVISSTLVYRKDYDSFFAPATYQHTGYAYDGYWYNSGVSDTSLVASWYTESSGPYRGSNPSFPQTCLILLSKASLSIYAVEGDELVMWMIFLMADDNALTDNFNHLITGYAPSELSWANGLLSISYEPDPGASSTSPVIVVTVDFTRDQIFLNTCLPNS